MMSREEPRPDTGGRWQDQAVCKTRPDLNWFPGQGERFGEQREVCAGCPVKDDCLAAALEMSTYDDFGIWGGTSERQRSEIRRGRAGGPAGRKTRSDKGVPRGGRPLQPISHGTRAGAAAHRRRAETPCDHCVAAEREYCRTQRANRRAP